MLPSHGRRLVIGNAACRYSVKKVTHACSSLLPAYLSLSLRPRGGPASAPYIGPFFSRPTFVYITRGCSRADLTTRFAFRDFRLTRSKKRTFRPEFRGAADRAVMTRPENCCPGRLLRRGRVPGIPGTEQMRPEKFTIFFFFFFLLLLLLTRLTRGHRVLLYRGIKIHIRLVFAFLPPCLAHPRKFGFLFRARCVRK